VFSSDEVLRTAYVDRERRSRAQIGFDLVGAFKGVRSDKIHKPESIRATV
jgi:hypothetical protein